VRPVDIRDPDVGPVAALGRIEELPAVGRPPHDRRAEAADDAFSPAAVGADLVDAAAEREREALPIRRPGGRAAVRQPPQRSAVRVDEVERRRAAIEGTRERDRTAVGRPRWLAIEPATFRRRHGRPLVRRDRDDPDRRLGVQRLVADGDAFRVGRPRRLERAKIPRGAEEPAPRTTQPPL